MAGKGDIVERALKLVMGGGDDAAKKAFSNTRLKTPHGDPMRLYHMTPEDIFEFRASPENRSGPAVFLSPYSDYQPSYHQSAETDPSGELTEKFKEGANVMPVYADVRNPLVLDHPRKIKEAAAKYQGGDPNFPRIISPEARAALEAEGYDGIVFGGDNPIPYGDRPADARLGHQEARDEEFLVFDPRRIKSAISNTGEYDFTNPYITKADGGQVREGYQTKGRVVKKLAEGIVDAVTGRSPNRVFPELADRYPEVKDPVTAFDKKKGKEYLAKDLSPEALAVEQARKVIQNGSYNPASMSFWMTLAVEQARKVIQKDIDAGLYEPFFDVKARADVDPFNYPSTGKTIDVKLVKPETQAKYRAMAFNPEGLDRLREGYITGLKQKDVAENWYFVKQLEDKFVEEYGPEEGRKLFKERFAKPMALTTGGADPTSNLLMSYYGNFLREKGLPIPEAAYKMPYPIGGQFASPNMGMFSRNMERELTPDNPKRFNFQNNFLGYKEPTIDEQISKGFDPKLQAPEWYGPYEEAINMLAREYEVDPRYFQEVAWAGLKSKGKGGYQGISMIQHINEAIERTSRLTGLPPEEVVRRGLVRGEMPIYGIAAPAGALAVGSMDEDADEDIDNAVRVAKGGGGGFTKIVRSLFGPVEKEGLEALTKAGSGYKGIPGKPDVVKIPLVGEVEAKPIGPIERAAEDYMRRLGRPGAHKIDVFPPLDEKFAAKVGEAYGAMKHAPTDPVVKRAYDAMAQETLDQLEAAKGAGIDFTFVKGEDPYKLSPSLGYADLAERGHLYVFPTEQGFGSDVAFDPSNNPLLKRIGPLGDLENATINDAFRIVHDLFGHFGPGNPFFRAPGEERAFKLHSKMYSPEALPAMASETRGQNSWLNFGPYGRYNRGANAQETMYADQKTGIMPPWAYEKADGGAIDGAIRIAKDVGGSTSVFMEDAVGNKYDVNGNVIPPTNPGPNPGRNDANIQTTYQALDKATVPPQTAALTTPRYSDKYAQQSNAIGASRAEAMGGIRNDQEPTNLQTWNSLPSIVKEDLISQYPELEEEMRLERDIDYYKNAQRAKASQPYNTQSMTHDAPVPRKEMKIDMPILGGEYSMGTAPYDVAEGLQGMAQTAYDFKTLPAYFFPPAAPFALGTDILEARLRDDPLGVFLNVALTPQGASAAKSAIGAIRRNPKATAAAIGAGAYLSPDEAEAGPARWFSKAMEVARALPMEKMTGQQALAMLRKGVSPEELRWTGADAFLPQQKQITKQDLVDYLAKNRVQTQDVVLGGDKPKRLSDILVQEIPKEIKNKYEPQINTLINEKVAASLEADKLREKAANTGDKKTYQEYYALVNKINEYNTQINELSYQMRQEYIDSIGGFDRATKYASYSTPGGEGYRETLYQFGKNVVPAKVVRKGPKWHVVGDNGETLRNEGGQQHSYYVQSDAESAARSISRQNSKYQSPHWDEPDVIAHTRSNTLTYEPPGSNRPYKVHNVEETQSDLAQKGRKIGFRNPDVDKRLEQLDLERNKIDLQYTETLQKIENEFKEETKPISEEYIRRIQQNDANFRGEINRRQYEKQLGDDMTWYEDSMRPYREKKRGREIIELTPLKKRENELRSEIEILLKNQNLPPLMPYVGSTEGWTDFAIKKELDRALDSDADYFSWSPGDVHAERYDLSKHISKVYYNPDDGNLIAYDPNGKLVIHESVNDPADLDEYVGKELADKMRAEEKSRRDLYSDSIEIAEGDDGYWTLLMNGDQMYTNDGEPFSFTSPKKAKDYMNQILADEFSENPVELSGLDLKVGGEGMRGYYDKIYLKRVQDVIKKSTGIKPEIETITVNTEDGPRQQLGVRLTDEMREKARFSDFNKGGRVADPFVSKALLLTSGD